MQWNDDTPQPTSEQDARVQAFWWIVFSAWIFALAALGVALLAQLGG